MSRLAQYLDARRDRFDRLNAAVREFEKAQPSYAYQAGFYLTNLLSLAADDKDSTEDLLRLLRKSVVNTQQSAV